MLKETITRILGFTETLQGYDFNEAATKHFVVLPILRDLEWNCDNLENLEVFPDKSTESGPVDYALQHDGKARVFIVVKRWPTEPAPDELDDDIAPYVSQEEVDFVVLTNGKTWLFYLPDLPDVPWKTRRFCTIDLDNGDEAASEFQKYLSKPYVVNGSAKKEAKAIVEEITGEKPDSREQLLCKVRKIIRKIEDKASGGDYIFRGEPECYPKVSSTLYRQYEKILTDRFNVEEVQNKMLIAAKEHLPGTTSDFETTSIDMQVLADLNLPGTTSDFETPVRRLGAAIGIPSEPDYGFETLTELQHYGGKTNLIDFTTDSRVALFFACDGSPSKKGRVIFRKKGDIEELVENPREPINPLNRVIAQKSIFVRPRRGFVEFDPDKDVVVIPVVLKKPMLEYLQKYHNISAKTVYNDLHGFIRIQDIHHKAYEALYRGLSAEDKGDFDRAIKDFTTAIELKPDFAGAYNSRGIAYSRKGDFDRAIKDFTTAIELKPDFAGAYNNRGIAYVKKRDFDKAIQNYDKAIELKPRLAEAYCGRGVAYGEKRDFDKAIQDLTTAIELKPDDAEAYCGRGVAYGEKRDFDKAIQDLTTAIELKPDDADAYCNRGEAWMHMSEWDKAKEDLTFAKDRGVDIIASFQNAYENVADFEQKNGVQVPADIAEMLTRR